MTPLLDPMPKQESHTAYFYDICPSEYYCTDDNGIVQAPPSPCQKTTDHVCVCSDGQEFPIIIDGESVRLGTKVFTDEEIQRLQTLNGDSQETTFSIFREVDAETRTCTLEYRTDVHDNWWYYSGPFNAQGQRHGLTSAFPNYSPYRKSFATFRNGQYHGFQFLDDPRKTF